MARISVLFALVAIFCLLLVPLSTNTPRGGRRTPRSRYRSSSLLSRQSGAHFTLREVEVIKLSDDNDDVFEEEEWHRYAESACDLSCLRRMNNEEREETLRDRWDRALLRLSWLEQGLVTEDELSSF